MYVHKGLAISVIDDDPQMAESMVKFLKQKFTDAEITVYHTGKAALQGIINEPDLIILDYHLDAVDMDNFNGLQVLIKIKERFQHTPVIFLSSQEQAEIA